MLKKILQDTFESFFLKSCVHFITSLNIYILKSTIKKTHQKLILIFMEITTFSTKFLYIYYQFLSNYFIKITPHEILFRIAEPVIQQPHISNLENSCFQLIEQWPLTRSLKEDKYFRKQKLAIILFYYSKYIAYIKISRKTREKNQSFLSIVKRAYTIDSHRLDESFCFHIIVIWWQVEGGRGRLYWRNESFKVNDFTISNNDFYGFKCFQLIRLCADSGLPIIM